MPGSKNKSIKLTQVSLQLQEKVFTSTMLRGKFMLSVFRIRQSSCNHVIAIITMASILAPFVKYHLVVH